VEAYSTTAAASINQLAQNTQAQGSYDAQTTEARASRESGMLRNQAAFISGKAQALSSAQSSAGAAMAAARGGVSQSMANCSTAASVSKPLLTCHLPIERACRSCRAAQQARTGSIHDGKEWEE